MSDDWNPNDPDATRVHYDLGSWTFDQQADLASELAELDIPHTWEGAELVVPEELESRVDDVIAQVEQRLGIRYDDTDGASRAALLGEDGPLPEPVALGDDEAATEYPLDEWDDDERAALTRALTRQGHAFRWEGTLLLVRTDDEAVVESLLDLVEAGDEVDLEPDELDVHAEDDRLPFETLTTFFLAGDRLKRDPLDADGLEQLLAAVDVADPAAPPYGVEARLWQRTCELADELADALAGDDLPDEEAAVEIADELYELLRPYI